MDENNMQNENECEECKEELNNKNNEDHGEMTGVDGKLAGVAWIAGVEAKIDEDSEDKEDNVEVVWTKSMDHEGIAMTCSPGSHIHDYSHLHGDLEHTMLTQYNVKKGLKLSREAGANAVVTEIEQLHDYWAVIMPKHANMLTWEEKQWSLQYLMFLKQMWCGHIKGCGCANSWKQWVYKTKEETSTPTILIELLFLSCIIDAKEGHKVATCDIPRAFMQVDIDEVFHLKLKGPLATLLTRVDLEKCMKYLLVENGKEVMYVQLANALYGTPQEALLFWKDLTGYLLDPKRLWAESIW